MFLDEWFWILVCAIPLVLVLAFFAWLDRRERERKLEDRLKLTEEKLKKLEEEKQKKP